MDTLAPVSTIMTKDLITVNPESKLSEVRKIFAEHRIHHVPVVNYKKIVGIISKTDLLHFLKGLNIESTENILNEIRLQNYHAKDIMVTGMAKLASHERIDVALAIFKENLFHSIPIVDNDELVGLVTTYDIIDALAKKTV